MNTNQREVLASAAVGAGIGLVCVAMGAAVIFSGAFLPGVLGILAKGVIVGGSVLGTGHAAAAVLKKSGFSEFKAKHAVAMFAASMMTGIPLALATLPKLAEKFPDREKTERTMLPKNNAAVIDFNAASTIAKNAVLYTDAVRTAALQVKK